MTCKIPQCGRDCAEIRKSGFLLGYMDVCDRHNPEYMKMEMERKLN